jgi:GNAT superfamily N-acetyltransferase
MDERLLELERMIVDAWPAAETAEVDGWLLRASGGPTHRGNSVATLATSGAANLDERIGRAEQWYRERGQATMFQVGPCAAPAGLDEALAARGYVVEGAASFAAAPSTVVLERTERETAGVEVFVTSSPSRAWLDINAAASRFSNRFDSFLGFVARLGPRCRFVTVHAPRAARAKESEAPMGVDDTGQVMAAALGIAGPEPRLGIYAMLTAPAFRRRGAARAALQALARRALSEGVPELYLLFDTANVAASALYAESGFAPVYDYHYRSKPTANVG